MLLAIEDSASRSCQYAGLPDLSRPSVSYDINNDVLKGMYSLSFQFSCVRLNILVFCSVSRKCSISLIAFIKNLVSCVLKTFSVNSFFFVLMYSRNGRVREKLLSFVKTCWI